MKQTLLMDSQNSLNLKDLKKGYRVLREGREDAEVYMCIHCGEKFHKGHIYREEGEQLLEAEAAAVRHVMMLHGGPFRALAGLQKNITGFTETQHTILMLLYKGLSDSEIARNTGGKAASTIRNHRFQFRKRRREALFQLAVLDLLEEHTGKNSPGEETLHQFRAPLTTDDDRTIVTADEERIIAEKYLEFKENGEIRRLRKWPKKQKEKLVILDRITGLFSSETTYSEKEVNGILSELHEEYVTIRRYLVDYGFFQRQPGGGPYRRNNPV